MRQTFQANFSYNFMIDFLKPDLVIGHRRKYF